MDYQQLQAYQQQILNQALNESLRRNSEQTKIWTDYKKRHVKVIEGLKVLPNNLSVNCMVPIGKKALMKGKIVHTNEIMVCLGDGYFVKYSAPQAIELCNRRIKKADEMISLYKKEKDLLEMRKMVPEGFDSFGNDEIKDYFEPCYDEVKPKGSSRIAHVAKYKECEKKLNDLKNKKTEDDQSDEDLFSRLDALELEEELKDELERLEDEYPDYHQLYLEGYEDESEVDSDDDSYQSDYSEDAINEIPHKKLSKINHRLKVLNNANSFDDESIMEPIKFFESHNLSTNTNKSDDKTEVREKKVVFAEPQVKYFTNEEEEEEEKINIVNEKRRISVIEQRIYECSKQDDDSDDEIEDAETSNEYHHEENIVSDTDDNQMTTSHDIQSLPTPKSILKKRSDVNINQQSLASSASSITTIEEEINDQQEELVSAYATVVKDITEHAELKMPSQIKEEVEQKRPVSKFKMERAGALRK